MEEEKKDKDALSKKIEKLYRNYGIDISEIEEDELERLKEAYSNGKSSIDNDLKNSEQHRDKFIEVDLI